MVCVDRVQPVTTLRAVDVNNNLDASSDRVVFNPNEIRAVGLILFTSSAMCLHGADVGHRY
jgi:hypothetical protein